MASMDSPVSQLPRKFRNLVVAVLAFVLGWLVLWGLAALHFRNVIDGWISEGQQAGYTITYDMRESFGFPFRFILRFHNLEWHNTDNIHFRAGVLDLSVYPWEWGRQHYRARLHENFVLEAPLDEGNGQKLHLAGNDADARVMLGPDGHWLTATLNIDDAGVGLTPNHVFRAERITASLEKPETPPRSHKDVGLTIRGEAQHVTVPDAMPTPFGREMAHLSLDMRVMGPMPDVRQKASVKTWNDGGGAVEFRALDMDWGPMTLRGRGTIAFDDDLQPEGAFVAAITGQEAVVKALMDFGFIAERQAGMLDTALTLFAKDVGENGQKGIELPIAVQLGGLFLGPVRIFMFPQIEWGE